jgi:hypothetical protein
MSEVQQPDDGKLESIGEYNGSLAHAYSHFFGDTVVLVSLFHRGHGVMRKQDGSSGKKAELSPNEARAGCEGKKQAFLEHMRGINLNQTHAFGPVDRNFIEGVIALASGDWNDPEVIKQLMDQYKSVCHLWQ